MNWKSWKHLIQAILLAEEDGAQNYLVFQGMYRYFNRVTGAGSVTIFIHGNLKDSLMKIF